MKKMIICKCPTCGASYEGNLSRPYELGGALPISGQNRLIYNILAASFGKWVQTELLLSVLYGGPDGGPLYARNVLRQGIMYLRRLLPPLGIMIETNKNNKAGNRYAVTSYRMRWVSPPS